tara:strand:- start:4550 stop:5974 length:1425 start_codon:yes stop_codon:yes gene_type:complete
MTTILQTVHAPEVQDSILALGPKVEEAAANQGFGKVLEQTTHEEARENEDDEKSEKVSTLTERESVSDRTNAKLKGRDQSAVKSQKLRPAELNSSGQLNIEAVGPLNITKAEGSKKEVKGPLKEQVKSLEQQNHGKVKARPQAEENDQSKSVTSGKISDEQKAQRALKWKQVRQAVKTEAREKVRQELKSEDKAKSTELRARNAPAKVPAINLLNTTKPVSQAQNSAVNERETANGTQVAVNSGRMVVQAKQFAASEAARPALVEELRPATSAEVSSQAGSQQQDLPRDEAKENILSPAPVMAVTSAATGTGALQAFTPSAGVITPMMEKIWNAVSTFRARGGDEVVVKLQPDSKTEVQLTIKYGNAGVEIQARMQQGDGQKMTSGWSELQQALADRGVSLSDLAREGSTESSFEQKSHNFDKNSQNQAQNEDLNIGDDQGDWSALGLRPKEENKGQTRREKVLPTHDGWQSWA